MICEQVQLIKGNDRGILRTYKYDCFDKESDAILIIPGGGYGCVCDDREGDPIAMAFASRGIRPFVLCSYSVGEFAKYPQPLIEASCAMAYIKGHAEEFGVNPDRVFVTGFSAGGHLAASLGTNWHRPEVNEGNLFDFGKNKPTGIILGYPVLCFFPETHLGTFYNAFGTENPTQKQIDECSLEKNVDERTCPAFIFHTSDDDCVNVINSLKFGEALRNHNIKFEMHIYPGGPHGMALANETTAIYKDIFIDREIAKWPDLAVNWIKREKF